MKAHIFDNNKDKARTNATAKVKDFSSLSDMVAKTNPINLKRMAKAIACSYKDKGAIIITFGEEGIRIGTSGLSHKELNEVLCTAIHYNFCFEG